MHTLQDLIRRFIEDNFLLGPQSRGFGNGDSLVERAIVDSTGFLELVAFIEERFGLTVADEELVPDNLETLDRIAAWLQRRGVHV